MIKIADYKMNDCLDAIDITSFLRGSLEKIKPCNQLRTILEIDNAIIPYPTLLVHLHRKLHLERGQIPVPLPLTTHFYPHKNITKQNFLDVLAHHCRYPQADLKYIFVNPSSLPTIVVNDMQAHPNNNQVVKKTPIEDGFCKTCGAYFKKENLKEHLSKACFAQYHTLHNEQCQELKMLLALNIFVSRGGPRVQCTICDRAYTTISHSYEITEHAVSHADKFLAPDAMLFDAKEKLWENLQEMEHTPLQICVPCQRYFTTSRMYYLHLALFDHMIEKNVCSECKMCINTQMITHYKEVHQLEAGCPFACVCADELLPHHITNQHRQYSNVIPEIEATQIKNVVAGINFSHKVYGEYGIITFDRNFIIQTKTACNSPIFGLNIINRYEKYDNHAWQVCKNIVKARLEKREIRSEYLKEIQRNPFRYVTKILLQERFDSSQVKREENPELIFHMSIQRPEENVFPHQFGIRYTTDLLEYIDVIIIGNDVFNSLTSSDTTKLLNVSTRENTIWVYRSFGGVFPQTEISYNDFITTNINRIEKGIEHTIVIEASLRPILEKVDPHQRVQFLSSNVSELARAFLAMVCEVQKQFKYTVITTYFHTLESPHFSEELPFVYQFNEYLRIASLILQLGLIEVDTAQIYTLQVNNREQHFRINSQLSQPFGDRYGNLTRFGRDTIIEMIAEFEKEKRLLLNQIKE